MNEQGKIIQVAWMVGQAFDRCGVDYLVGGSVASSLQGHPRFTRDIDFVAHLSAAKVDALIAALGPDFMVDDVALKDAMRSKGSWNIFYAPTMLRIDIFAIGPTEYDVESFFRRVKLDVGSGRSIWVAAPEDTVLRKLMWFKEGGEQSALQFRDVVDVLRVKAASLNATYLDRWASKLGIGSLLQRARDAADFKLTSP